MDLDKFINNMEKCILCHLAFLELLEDTTELSEEVRTRVNHLLTCWTVLIEKVEV